MRPDSNTLRALYLCERLSADAIARKYGVSKRTALRWLDAAGVDRRPQGRGLRNRGIVEPTPDELREMVHVSHMSYEAIAARYGVDFTAVPKWLEKHGIPKPKNWITRRGRDVVLPTRQQIETLYRSGLPLSEIAARFDIGTTLIRRLCTEYSIEVRRDGLNGGARLLCVDGHQVRSSYEQRVDDWLHEHGAHHVYEPQLPFDRRFRADFWVNGWYIEIWGVLRNPKYKNRTAHKRSLYRLHQVPLIELRPDDFTTASNQRWMRKLIPCITSAGVVRAALDLSQS